MKETNHGKRLKGVRRRRLSLRQGFACEVMARKMRLVKKRAEK